MRRGGPYVDEVRYAALERPIQEWSCEIKQGRNKAIRGVHEETEG